MAQLVLKNILAGSGNVLAGGDNTGNVTKVTIGANLTLSGGVLSASGGGTGSVTSVALTRSGNALTITGSPITTAGTINIGFAGTTAQYIRGDGTLATFPTITGYVPYTGATQNLDLGTYGLLADFVGFNTAPTSIPTTQGTLSWNVDKESLDLIMNGTTGSLMQDSFYNVKNQTGAAIPKGTVVRADGTVGASGRIKIAPFKADGTYSSKYCMGVTAETIADGADGKVLAFGALRKFDTSAYTNGTILYASPATAGAFTTTEPSNPNNIVTLAIVVYSDATNGEIFVRPTYVPDQAELIKSLGYTPANDANVVKLTGNQTVGGVKTFSSESIFGGGITLTGGDLVLKSGTYTNTINTDTLTESRSILFPDNSGTVALLTDIDYPVTSVFGRTGDVVAVSGDYDTDMVDEGTTNLYYTNARARLALSANTGSALTYNNTTGRFTLNAADSGTSGYLTAADWTDFDSKQASLGTGTTSQFLRGDLVWAAPPTPALEDLTDVGITSPTNGQLLRYQVGTWVNWTPNYVSATYFSATAPLSYNSGTGVFSISQATTSTNGYLSSTDWNTFNNKQNALTNPVTGTGATGYIAKWNTASTITNSLIYEASSKVGINTTNMVSLFDVTKNALGVTVVDTSGITLKNETEAITGNQQISPALHFKSNGWNNLASASQSADWINYSLPIQGNAVTSNLLWASSVNGAAYTTRFTLSSAGNGTFTGTLSASNLSGTNTGDVTIGTANGLSLSGQAISLALASGSTTGALSSTDWNTFNNKQAPITNPVTGTGTATRVAFWDGTNSITSASGFYWDNSNGRLAIGKNSSDSRLEVYGGTKGQIRANGGTSLGAGLDLYTELSGVDRRNWAIYTESTDAGDFEILRSNSAGTAPTVRTLTLAKSGEGTIWNHFNIKSASSSGIALYLDNTPRTSGRSWSLLSGNTAVGEFSIKDENAAATRLKIGTDGVITTYVTASIGIATNATDYMRISENQIWRTGGPLYLNSSGSGQVIIATGGGGVSLGTTTLQSGFVVTTNDQGVTGNNTYFGTGNVRIGGGADHTTNTVLSVAPGVVNFDRPGIVGGALKIASTGQVFINTTGSLQGSEQLAVSGSANTAIIAKFTGGGTSGWGAKIWNDGASGDNLILEFLTETSITARGSVTYNRTSNAIQYNGSNALNLATNGSPRFYITSGGNLGLNVPANGTGTGIEFSSSGSTPRFNWLVSNSYIGELNATSSLFRLKTNGAFPIYFTVNNSTDGMIINSNGKVLINLASASAVARPLEVNGQVAAIAGSIITELDSNSTLGAGYAGTQSNHPLILKTNDTGRVTIAAAGNIAINGSVLSTIKLYMADTGANITSGNAIYGTNMKGMMIENTNNGDESIGLWFRTGFNHLSGISAQRNNSASTWGTDLRFYTHENATVDLTYAKERMRLTSEGELLIGSLTNPGYKLYISGSVGATGGYFESSDKRLKKEISDNPIINGINNIKPKLYIKDGKEELGYYAQELEDILPSAVYEGKDGFLSLSYNQVLVAKVANLEGEITELKEIVKNLINELGRNSK